MEEAVSGVRGQLAVKLYGDDLRLLEKTADNIVRVMSKIKGFEGSWQSTVWSASRTST